MKKFDPTERVECPKCGTERRITENKVQFLYCESPGTEILVVICRCCSYDIGQYLPQDHEDEPADYEHPTSRASVTCKSCPATDVIDLPYGDHYDFECSECFTKRVGPSNLPTEMTDPIGFRWKTRLGTEPQPKKGECI